MILKTDGIWGSNFDLTDFFPLDYNKYVINPWQQWTDQHTPPANQKAIANKCYLFHVKNPLNEGK